jgi:hypothetical protein
MTYPQRSTNFSRMEVGATWRSSLLGGLGIVLAPRLSYQALKLTVTPTITGLPDANLTGIQVGSAPRRASAAASSSSPAPGG